MMTLDENLFLWLNTSVPSPVLDSLFSVITQSGWAPVALCLGLAGVFIFAPAPKWRAAALLMAAMAAGGGLTHVSKQLYARDRPLAHFEERIKNGTVTMRAPQEQLRHRSFPSGHAQAAFTAAVFIALLTQSWAIRAAVLAWALAVGLSRIYLGVHFPTDVAAGAALGAAVAWIVFRIGVKNGPGAASAEGSGGSAPGAAPVTS
jgi:undecaprenyl-diphosphatase